MKHWPIRPGQWRGPFTCVAVCAAVLFHPTVSRSQTEELVLHQSDNFVLLCETKVAGCDPETPDPERIAAVKAATAEVLPEAEAILTWFGDLSFPPSAMSRRGGKKILTYSPSDACKDPSAVACSIDGLTGVCGVLNECRTIALPEAMALSGKIDKETIAHELFHTLHDPGIPDESEVQWLDEATATAVGRAWSKRQGQGDVGIGYVLSLDRPFFDGVDDGYEKGHYFRTAGQQIGSPSEVGYFADFFKMTDDGKDGMTYPYGNVPGLPFDSFFPTYVAGFNSFRSSYQGDQGDYYDTYQRETAAVNDPTISNFDEFQVTAQRFAAAPVHVEKITTAKFPEEEEKDLLLVAEIEVRNAERPEDLSLILEDKLSKNLKTSFLFTGFDAIDGGFVRVTNAGQSIDDTDTQSFSLRYTFYPIEFILPLCVETGGSAEIVFRGDMRNADNWRLVPGAGRIDDLTFTAGASAGEVEVTLEIYNHVARPPEERAVDTPDTLKVDLGHITVTPQDCDIRMEALGHNVTATYSGTGDFTEYAVPTGGHRGYIGANRIAMFIPAQGGWQAIPASAQAMLAQQLRSMVGVPVAADNPPWAEPDTNVMGRMPLLFTRWYDWLGMTDALFPGEKKSRIGTRVACPSGGTGCVEVSFEGVSVGSGIYDRDRKLVELRGGGERLRFTYGQLNVPRPPGW